MVQTSKGRIPTSSFLQQIYLEQNLKKKNKTDRVFALPEKSTNTLIGKAMYVSILF